jgi:hypothetical protein
LIASASSARSQAIRSAAMSLVSRLASDPKLAHDVDGLSAIISDALGVRPTAVGIPACLRDDT